jgi:hypothetical protein
MTDRYTTPEEGTVDWHVPLNRNFERLDTDVEIRDAEASLGDYAPRQGAKFLATDTGRRRLGDGSEWGALPLAFPSRPSDPSDPVEGQLWYNTADGVLRINTGDGVVDIA